MSTRALLAVLAAALTGLVLISITTPWSGQVLVKVGGGHGVHTSDLPAVALWLVGIAALVGLAKRD